MNDAHSSHKLVQLTPNDKDQLKALRMLNDIDQELDILKHSAGISNRMEVLVPSHKLKFIKEFARTNKLKINIKSKNYGR